jgi:hypothetical protein
MVNYKPQIGDIVLIDSDQTGARIVKFFMTAPTWYKHIWRALWKTQTKVEYYHVAMMLEDTMIEQQYRVRTKDWNPNSKQMIFRRKKLTVHEKTQLQAVSKNDLKKKWDILNAIGKFFTWLTGIPLFAMFVQWPNHEICVCRVASWYEIVLNEKFGCLTRSEITTQRMYEYLKLNPKYEIVYVN